MENNRTSRRSGYVYGPRTKAGFLRMQRLGIPRPPFRLEDRLARLLTARYKKLAKELIADFLNEARKSNAQVQDQAPLTTDSLDDLLNFFDEMKDEMESSKDAVQQAQNRAALGNVMNNLEDKWLKEDPAETTEGNPEADQELKDTISTVLQQDQTDYLTKLMKDADNRTAHLIGTFAIDKREVFEEHMARIRQLYLDNSIERIGWEQDYIKRAMLRRISAYVSGRDDKLRLDDLIKLATSSGNHMARLFARDQMARFNKALTIASYESGSVTKVKWVTSHDGRVRQTHKDLDGKIFNIKELPPEIDDYNCRCGLVPVEWSE